MTTPAAAHAPITPAALRSNSLAIAFQDVITVILRVRYRVQRVSDVASFRESLRKMIVGGAQETRNLGYSDATTQMALYAIVAFLDESVLNSQEPAFQDWSRRPLQEEMFGNHFAGEYFFRHVGELLNAQDTQEGADALELHALCLQLGYRGKYAMGGSGDVGNIIRLILDKITRTRGQLLLIRTQPEPPVILARRGDPWVKRLVLATAAIAILTIVAFVGYMLLLSGNLGNVQTAALFAPAVIAFERTSILRGGLVL